MAVVLLLIAPLTALSGYWTWRYQQKTVARLFPVPSLAHSLEREVLSTGKRDHAVGPGRANTAKGDARVGLVATEQLDGAATPLFGWTHFSVISIVVLEGTAILACRGREEASTARPRGWRPSSRSQWPLLLASDQTLVLRMGEGVQACRAGALLERWRRSAAILSLGPTAAPGGVEFSDSCGSAIQAMLVTD